MCDEAASRDPYTLKSVSDPFITQEICNKAMRKNPAAFFLVPDHYKTREMCNDAVDVKPWQLNDVPDSLKRKKCVTMWCRGTHILYSLSLIGLLLMNN